jgi:hypothetical protein
MWSGADVFGPSDLCSRAATGRCGSVRTGAFRVIPFDVTPQFLGRLVGQSHRGDAISEAAREAPAQAEFLPAPGVFRVSLPVITRPHALVAGCPMIV